MGGLLDNPNQQVVRGSGPGIDSAADPAVAEEELSLDEMTKAQLLEYAQARGYSPANAAMSKEEIRASIDEHEQEG